MDEFLAALNPSVRAEVERVMEENPQARQRIEAKAREYADSQGNLPTGDTADWAARSFLATEGVGYVEMQSEYPGSGLKEQTLGGLAGGSLAVGGSAGAVVMGSNLINEYADDMLAYSMGINPQIVSGVNRAMKIADDNVDWNALAKSMMTGWDQDAAREILVVPYETDLLSFSIGALARSAWRGSRAGSYHSQQETVGDVGSANPWIEGYAERFTETQGNLVTRTLREIVDHALYRGEGSDTLSRRLKRSWALSPRSALSVSNLERGLKEQEKPRPQITRQANALARRLRGNRVKAVGRTEAMTTFNLGRERLWRRAVLDGQMAPDTVKMWVTARDELVCKICRPMDAQTVALGEQFTSDSGRVLVPAVHPNCFPAGVEVTGPQVKGSTTRWYEGSLVELRFASGNDLSVTPNHPILTSRGWVDAGVLVEGDEIVRSLGGERESLGIEMEHDQGPALIEDVAATVGESSSVSPVPVPVSSEHFHGDGEGSEVAVVRADGLLGDRGQPTFSEHVGEQDFTLADSQTHLFSGLGSHRFLAPGMSAPAHGGVGSTGVGAMFLGGALRREVPVGVGIGSDRDSALLQRPSDRDAADTVLAGELRDGRAGEITLDEIVEVRRVPFAGHVYNLETVEGWYTANGVISHNCRCLIVPVSLHEASVANVSGERTMLFPKPKVAKHLPGEHGQKEHGNWAQRLLSRGELDDFSPRQREKVRKKVQGETFDETYDNITGFLKGKATDPKNRIEYGFLLDDENTIRKVQMGKEYEVSEILADTDLKDIKRSTHFHNHPRDEPPSPIDTALGISLLRESVIVSSKGTYSVRRPDDADDVSADELGRRGTEIRDAFDDAYEEHAGPDYHEKWMKHMQPVLEEMGAEFSYQDHDSRKESA